MRNDFICIQQDFRQLWIFILGFKVLHMTERLERDVIEGSDIALLDFSDILLYTTYDH